MKSSNTLTSACRCCHYYRPEGRRGGMCSQLGVLVQSNWSSCSLAVPAFTTTWEKLQDIVLLENSFCKPEINKVDKTKQRVNSEVELPSKTIVL